jgi:hypothetical protein
MRGLLYGKCAVGDVLRALAKSQSDYKASEGGQTDITGGGN